MFNRIYIFIIVILSGTRIVQAQCLSSVNPVGGTENILVLEKNSLRIISFYKYGQAKQYFEKDKHSDFDLISKAYYNYVTSVLGYGLSNRLTLEMESGYFINKSQVYNTQPEYTLRGRGFSNIIVSAKYNVYANPVKRRYYSASFGIKIPGSRKPQMVNNVELPVEVQPTIGAYGLVFNSFFVKENSEKGLRYFITNRVETNFLNDDDYRLGTAIFNSFFISKHLMASWIKGDWTTILQLRNEIRLRDKVSDHSKESSGGTVFYIVPQVNYVIKEKWYLSAIIDLPFYQYFNGTQLGAGIGITFSLSRTFNLKHTQ